MERLSRGTVLEIVKKLSLYRKLTQMSTGHLWKSALTEDDGKSWCIAKILSLMAMVAMVTGGFLCLYHTPDAATLSAFGNGLGIVLGGTGIGIAGKQLTQRRDSDGMVEPKP